MLKIKPTQMKGELIVHEETMHSEEAGETKTKTKTVMYKWIKYNVHFL